MDPKQFPNTPQADTITGAIIIANKTQRCSVHVIIDGTTHATKIERNQDDTAWKVSCSCGDAFAIVDVQHKGRDKAQAFRDAAAEAWNHISGTVYYSITGD